MLRRKLRRKWYYATHLHTYTVYDPPHRIPGSYFSIDGIMTISEKRWYKRLMRVLWGQEWRKHRMGYNGNEIH